MSPAGLLRGPQDGRTGPPLPKRAPHSEEASTHSEAGAPEEGLPTESASAHLVRNLRGGGLGIVSLESDRLSSRWEGGTHPRQRSPGMAVAEKATWGSRVAEVGRQVW